MCVCACVFIDYYRFIYLFICNFKYINIYDVSIYDKSISPLLGNPLLVSTLEIRTSSPDCGVLMDKESNCNPITLISWDIT